MDDPDLRALLLHAKDWAAYYTQLAERSAVPYRRVHAWVNERGRLTQEEAAALAAVAEAHIAEQRKAVELVDANPAGVAAAVGVTPCRVQGWRWRQRVPVEWMPLVLGSGPPLAPPPPKARRLGPIMERALRHVADSPRRAYPSAVDGDLGLPGGQATQALARLERRGLVEVAGEWQGQWRYRRKMYRATDAGLAMLAKKSPAPGGAGPSRMGGVAERGGNLARDSVCVARCAGGVNGK